MTKRFKALEDAVAQLPPEARDALAEALEDALEHMKQAPPTVAADVRAVIDRALERHAASVQYLKDK